MSKRMDVRVKVSRFDHAFVCALQKFMVSWNFDLCGMEWFQPWEGIYVSSTAEGPVAPKPQKDAAEPCKHTNCVNFSWTRDPSESIWAKEILICKDCNVLLGAK